MTQDTASTKLIDASTLLKQLRKMRFALFAGAFLASGVSAQASTSTWSGASGGDWGTNTNWSGTDTPPASGDTALFNSGSGTSITVANAIANQAITSISFDTAAGNYTINGPDQLQLQSGGTTQILSSLTATNAVETINAPIVLEGASGTYTFANNSANGTGAGAGTLNFGGQISGGVAGTTTLTLSGSNTNANTIGGNIIDGTATHVAVTKSGAGTWVLSGSNTYSGTTSLSAGTLVYQGVSSMSANSGISPTGGTISLLSDTSNATFTPASFGPSGGSTTTLNVGPITGAGGIGLIFKPTAAVTVGGSAGQTMTFDVTGSSGDSLTLSDSNGLAFTNNSAKLELVPTTANLTVTANLGSGGTSSTNTLVLDGTSSNNIYSGNITNSSGTVSVTKSNSSTWTLSGSNTYTGATTVSGGTLELNFAASGAPATNIVSGSSALSMGGNTLQINGASSGTTAQTFNGTTINAGPSVIAVTNNGTAANLTLGTVTLSAGSGLILDLPAATPSTSAGGAIAVSNGTAALVGGNTTSYALVAGSNGVPTDLAAVNSSGFIQAAQSALPNSASGWESAPTNLVGTQPLLWVYNNTANAAALMGNSQNPIAPILYNTNNGTTGWSFNMNGSGRVGTLSFVGVTSGVGASNITFGGIGDLRVNSELVIDQYDTSGILTINPSVGLNGTGTGQIVTQNGTGTVVFSPGATASYTGATYLNGGVTELGSGTLLPANSTNINLNGGTILGSATFSLNGTGETHPIVLGSYGGGLAAVSGQTLTVNAGISGGVGALVIGLPTTGGLVPGTGASTANTTAVNATGTVTLTGTNSYTGGTVIDSGTLLYNGTQATLGSSSAPLAVNTSSSTLNLGTSQSLTAGAVTLGGGTIESGASGSTSTLTGTSFSSTGGSVSAILAGSGATFTNVSGTTTLSGANTYTGATSVNGGTLNVAGSLASGSPVAVNTGGTLSGAGTIGGAVTVAGGATSNTLGGTINLNNGSANDTLTLSNGLTLGGTGYSQLDFEATLTSTADNLAITGGLTVNSGGADITITNLGITSGNRTFTLATFTGSFTGGSSFGTSGTTIDGFTLTDPSLAFGITGALEVTAASNGALELVTTGAAAPASAYWSGAQGATWASNSGGNGNFTTTLDGGTYVNALPGSTTAVTFSDNGSTNLTNTLGANFDIASLTFLGTTNHNGAVTINADGNTLTLESGGLTVNSGAGAVTIGSKVALNASQTWANASSSSLSVSGVISNGVNGAAGLTVNNASTGTTTLSGANTYTGGTTVQAGTLVAGVSNATTVSGAFGPSANGVTLGNSSSTGSSNPTLLTGGAFTVSNPITVSSNSAGTDTIGGNTATTSTFSGTTTLDNNLTVTQVTGGTLDLTGNITSGASGTQTLKFNNVGAVAQSTGVIGGGTGTIAVTKAGTGTTTLTSAETYTGATTISAGTLMLGTGTSGQDGSIANTASITDNGTLAYDLYGNQTNSIGITGTTGALTKAGSGTLTLSGNNTYGGTTTVSGGTLTVGTGAANTGSIGTSSANISVVSNASLQVSGGSVTANTLYIGSNLDATTNPSGFVTIGAGSTVTASHTTFDGSGNAGALTINGGTVSLGAITDGRDSSNNGTASLTTGLIINGGSVTATSANISSSNSGADVTITGGSLTINPTSTGAFIIGDGSSATRGGFLTVTSGTLTDTYSDGLLLSKTATYGVANLSGGTTTLNAITLNSGNNSGATSSLTLSGGAFLYLGAAGYTGTASPTSVASGAGIFEGTGGTLSVNLSGGTLGASGNWASSAPITLSNAAPATIQAADINGNAYKITLSGAITGAGGALIKTGTGTLSLTSTGNTYNGGTTISAGTLQINGIQNVGGSAGINSNGITFNGGTLQYAPSASGAGPRDITNNGNASVAVTSNNGTIDVNGNTITYVGGLGTSGSGAAGGLTVKDSGTQGSDASGEGLTLDGVSTYAGATNISSANLYVADTTGTALSDSSGVNLSGSAVFDISQTDTPDYSGLGEAINNLTGTGTVYLGDAVLTVGSASVTGSGSGTFAGVIANGGISGDTGGSLVKEGSGTLTLTGVNTYSGGTTIAEGAIVAGNNSAFGTGGITTEDPTIVYSNGVTIGNTITMAGPTTLDLEVDNTDSATQQGAIGEINGSQSLAKTGTGTLTFTGTNTYSGGTTVAAGTLYANSASATGSGAVQVNSGGTLAGSGTVAGAVTVHTTPSSPTATLASGALQTSYAYTGPGAAPASGAGSGLVNGTGTGGGLTLSSTLSVNGGSTLTFALGSNVDGRGGFNLTNPNTDSTYLTVGGSGDIFSNTTTTDNILLTDLTYGESIGSPTLTLRYQGAYLLIDGTSADFSNLYTTGAGNTGTGYVLGVDNGSGGYTPFNIEMLNASDTQINTPTNYGGLQLYLNNGELEVVPEPGTWVLMFGGFAFLLLIGRMRRKNG